MNSLSQRLLFSFVLLISCAPAYAYLDPGTGSALIQGLIAVVAALGVTMKLYWHRVKGFLGLGKDEESKTPNDISDKQ